MMVLFLVNMVFLFCPFSLVRSECPKLLRKWLPYKNEENVNWRYVSSLPCISIPVSCIFSHFCTLMNTLGMGVSWLGSIVLYGDSYEQIGRIRETTSSQAPIGCFSIHGYRWQWSFGFGTLHHRYLCLCMWSISSCGNGTRNHGVASVSKNLSRMWYSHPSQWWRICSHAQFIQQVVCHICCLLFPHLVQVTKRSKFTLS